MSLCLPCDDYLNALTFLDPVRKSTARCIKKVAHIDFRAPLMLYSNPITLSKNIAAIAIEGTEQGRPRCGLIAQLPKGTQLEIVGEGFNNRTAMVRYHDRAYFVFLQDIEEPDSSYYLS